MGHPFNPYIGLIVVPVALRGPQSEATVNLALDTGATTTVVNRETLEQIGCQPDQAGIPREVTTGSGIESVHEVRLASVRALGKAMDNFPVLCHDLPSTVTVDGVLGLDFLRGGRLKVDFRAGLLSLD